MKNSLSHSSWECKYHIVWVPKRRRREILSKLKKEVEVIIGKLCSYKKIEVLELKVCEDHVHACLSIPPKYAISNIMGYLKGKSTMILFEMYSPYRRNFKGHTFWARGYYVNTVGMDEEKILKYIREQEENEMIENKYRK